MYVDSVGLCLVFVYVWISALAGVYNSHVVVAKLRNGTSATSSAATVQRIWCAGRHLLSAELSQRNIVDGRIRLDCLHRCKSPTRSATALVLGLSDHPLLPPVDRGRQVGGNLALGMSA